MVVSDFRSKLNVLPCCMMPDGADPCEGYHELIAKCEQLQKERDELRGLVKNVYLDIHISELTQTRKSVIKVWRSGQEYYAELTAHRGEV